MIEDLKGGKHKKIITRFPPEPNGFLHLGHAKSLSINYGYSEEYNGICNLRFDDTNPSTEDMRYIESIKEDVKWLGFNYEENIFYASDYFDQLYEWALILIQKNLAYVDHDSIQEIRTKRGNIITPGILSPYRDRSIEENLRLFKEMKDGKYEEGECVLRAKIDMHSSNMNMRDPIMYRILKKSHPRTQNKWCIYPMYDYAHGQSDSIENITHSICTLEFELHRPLYNWYQNQLEIFKTRQIEFARLNCTYMVMSKRKLLQLVEEGWVKNWDDPRMPTLSGMRRKGIPPKAILDFCDKIGVAKRENIINIELLENCIRDYLNKLAIRRFMILKPLKVVITNFDENSSDEPFEIYNHPNYPEMGKRTIYFGRNIYIDESDFIETPRPDFYRLVLGGEVRLKYVYCIKCNEVIKDENGKIVELRCTYDPSTKGGKNSAEGKKIKGTIHWMSDKNIEKAEICMYDRLFTKPNPEEDDEEAETLREDLEEEEKQDTTKDTQKTKNWKNYINKNSLQVYNGIIESDLFSLYEEKKKQKEELYLQFERVGFFVFDKDSTIEKKILNLTCSLIDIYANESMKKAKLLDSEARKKAALNRQLKNAKNKNLHDNVHDNINDNIDNNIKKLY